MERVIAGIDWSNGTDYTTYTLKCHKCGEIIGIGAAIVETGNVTFPIPARCHKCGQKFKNLTVLKGV